MWNNHVFASTRRQWRYLGGRSSDHNDHDSSLKAKGVVAAEHAFLRLGRILHQRFRVEPKGETWMRFGGESTLQSLCRGVCLYEVRALGQPWTSHAVNRGDPSSLQRVMVTPQLFSSNRV